MALRVFAPVACLGRAPPAQADASSGEFVEELEGPRRVKKILESSAHRLEVAQQFCGLDHVEAHPLGGAQEVARVTSGGASARERRATRSWLVARTRFRTKPRVNSAAKQRAAPMMRNAVLATLAAAASATVGFCNDKDRSCAAWGADGECTGDNAEHMKTVRSASN